MAWTPVQKYIAEFLGTFGLLFSVTGAVVFTSTATLAGTEPLVRITLISLSIGFGLTAMIYAFGDVSGAHFNPAVTIGVLLAGRMKTRDVIPYIVAQIFGAIVAVGAVAGIAYGSSPVWNGVTSSPFGLGAQGYSGTGSPYTFSIPSVFLLEVVITFLLVLTILYATRSEGFAKNLAPLGIGLVLLMINLVAIPVDGASANPARSFAPALLGVGFNGQSWALQQNWIFWVAPIIGAIVAGMVERYLRPGVAPHPSE